MTFAQRVTRAATGRQVLRFLFVMGVALAAVSVGCGNLLIASIAAT